MTVTSLGDCGMKLPSLLISSCNRQAGMRRHLLGRIDAARHALHRFFRADVNLHARDAPIASTR